MTPPSVFISYSHDSPEHKAWVERLATDLRSNHVDAVLDKWRLKLGQDVAAFMTEGIKRADRTLLICSAPYVTKSNAGVGGVGYERLIVTAELVSNIDTRKFIPVIRANEARAIPDCLGPRMYIDFSDDSQYQAKLEELLRELLGDPGTGEPPIGPNPFSGTPSSAPSVARVISPAGAVKGGGLVLDDEWFKTQKANAEKGISALGLTGHMELRLALHDSIKKSQLELLTSVRGAEIHTFGWPIGVTLDNRDEFRPRPFQDGIRAEVALTSKSFSGEPGYDYWALRDNGDFYLLQSLFEDQRATKALFFNTRIVRATEALMFGSRLYGQLGAQPESKVSARLVHRGLSGRTLASSTPNRDVWPSKATDDVAQGETTFELGTLSAELVDHVKRLVAPMFMLFDFKELADSVYSDIVRRFEKGEVS